MGWMPPRGEAGRDRQAGQVEGADRQDEIHPLISA